MLWLPLWFCDDLHVCILFCVIVYNGDSISARFGVSGELSRDEFVRLLSSLRQEQVKEFRSELFKEAVKSGLADLGDTLVGRRKIMVGGKTLKLKYVDDIWILVSAIGGCKNVPRTLLKNGKRSKAELMRSPLRDN